MDLISRLNVFFHEFQSDVTADNGRVRAGFKSTFLARLGKMWDLNGYVTTSQGLKRSLPTEFDMG